MEEKTDKNPLEPIIIFFSKYNLVIFLIVVVVGLSIAILTIASTIQLAYSDTVKSTNIEVSQGATILTLEKYNTSDLNSSTSTNILKRSGPFSE